MKRISLILLFTLILSIPVSAFSPRQSVSDRLTTIAWQDGDNVYVAIANNTSSRNTYTMETYEAGNRRTPLDRRSIVIPSRTLYIEEFSIRSNRGRDWPIDEVVVSDRISSIVVPVQIHDLLDVPNYVVSYNSIIDIEVDLLAIRQRSEYGQLLVDNEYTLSNGGRPGRISISTFEEGFSLSHARNRVDYRPPFIELSMRTPFMQGVGILTFGIMHMVDRPSSGYREYIQGPQILVYGSDIWLVEETSSRSSSDRVNR